MYKNKFMILGLLVFVVLLIGCQQAQYRQISRGEEEFVPEEGARFLTCSDYVRAEFEPVEGAGLSNELINDVVVGYLLASGLLIPRDPVLANDLLKAYYQNNRLLSVDIQDRLVNFLLNHNPGTGRQVVKQFYPEINLGACEPGLDPGLPSRLCVDLVRQRWNEFFQKRDATLSQEPFDEVVIYLTREGRNSGLGRNLLIQQYRDNQIDIVVQDVLVNFFLDDRVDILNREARAKSVAKQFNNNLDYATCEFAPTLPPSRQPILFVAKNCAQLGKVAFILERTCCRGGAVQVQDGSWCCSLNDFVGVITSSETVRDGLPSPIVYEYIGGSGQQNIFALVHITDDEFAQKNYVAFGRQQADGYTYLFNFGEAEQRITFSEKLLYVEDECRVAFGDEVNRILSQA